LVELDRQREAGEPGADDEGVDVLGEGAGGGRGHGEDATGDIEPGSIEVRVTFPRMHRGPRDGCRTGPDERLEGEPWSGEDAHAARAHEESDDDQDDAPQQLGPQDRQDAGDDEDDSENPEQDGHGPLPSVRWPGSRADGEGIPRAAAGYACTPMLNCTAPLSLTSASSTLSSSVTAAFSSRKIRAPSASSTASPGCGALVVSTFSAGASGASWVMRRPASGDSSVASIRALPGVVASGVRVSTGTSRLIEVGVSPRIAPRCLPDRTRSSRP